MQAEQQQFRVAAATAGALELLRNQRQHAAAANDKVRKSGKRGVSIA
jgi:hypothetical protein